MTSSAKDFFSFLRTTSSSRHAIRTPLLEPHRCPAIHARAQATLPLPPLLVRDLLCIDPLDGPITTPRVVVHAIGSSLLPIVCLPAGVVSAIAPSCWRLAKPSPAAVHASPHLVAVAVAARPRAPLRPSPELRHPSSILEPLLLTPISAMSFSSPSWRLLSLYLSLFLFHFLLATLLTLFLYMCVEDE
ncbi:hypothetical protein Syun_021709 [Stephania yunnanensis]|uniref:Uncharacterized protein n=1 Tax=Stephania yunnanensis TaxID=152371 RepID=A0AAP0IGH4_9MAGN